MTKYYIVGEYGVHASDAIIQTIDAFSETDAVSIFCDYVKKNHPLEWAKMGQRNISVQEQKSDRSDKMKEDVQHVIDQAADVLEEHVFVAEDGTRYECEANAWFHNLMLSFLRIHAQDPITSATRGEILHELIEHYQALI